LHNEEVRRTGWGQLMPERPTDFLEEAARQRYAIFIKHYDTLKTLRQHFTFNIIPAGYEMNKLLGCWAVGQFSKEG